MLNLHSEQQRIVQYIQAYCKNSGFGSLVVGLSGGIDSALTAALSVQALGKEQVFAYSIPYRESHPDSAADAALVANHLQIKLQTIELTSCTDPYFNTFEPTASPLRKGNWMARIRMNILYDQAAKHKSLVVGTSNRSELLVGYFTQFGDSACAFEPIGHLYKTEVWAMAAQLGLPDKVISKTPTADLWEGQSDESELGISYLELDKMLQYLTEPALYPDCPASPDKLIKVKGLIQNSEFKRNLPPVLPRV